MLDIFDDWFLFENEFSFRFSVLWIMSMFILLGISFLANSVLLGELDFIKSPLLVKMLESLDSN